MKITPIKTRTANSLKQCNLKRVKQRIPKKVTLDNLPAVATAIGFVAPIPFGFLIFGAIGKAIQIVAKKFLHKP